MTHAEFLAMCAPTGWLDRPATDPLRRIVERSLAKALGGPGTPPAAGLPITAARPRPS